MDGCVSCCDSPAEEGLSVHLDSVQGDADNGQSGTGLTKYRTSSKMLFEVLFSDEDQKE